MTRLLLVIALAFSLIACSTVAVQTPQNVEAKPSSASLVGIATLASYGTFEMELAPLYTRLAVLRYKAARQLRYGEINRNLAIEIQSRADRLRDGLDKAKQLDLDNKTESARHELTIINSALSRAERLLP